MKVALLMLALLFVFFLILAIALVSALKDMTKAMRLLGKATRPRLHGLARKKKEGYENSLDNAWTYDTGYDDGYEEKRPKYFNDPPYMDAYRDGKKDKKKRW